MRFSSRQSLIQWLHDHAPTPSLQRALDRAGVTVWGLFEGGFVVEVGKFVLGVRPNREKMGEWVCGFLSGIRGNIISVAIPLLPGGIIR